MHPGLELLGITDTTHNIERHRVFRDVPNRLEFMFTFRYHEQLGSRADGELGLSCCLEVTWFRPPRPVNLLSSGTRTFGPVFPEVTHVGYGKARASGVISFEIDPRARFSRFVLKVRTSEPSSLELDLGTYVHPDDREEDLLVELINEEKLLRLPSGWPLINVSDKYSTNIIPAGDFITRSSGSANELCERLAARTAQVIPRGHNVWPWSEEIDADDGESFPLSRTSRQANPNLDRILADLVQHHGVEVVNSWTRDNTVALALFQTSTFGDMVTSNGIKGLTIFGFSGVEPDITPVIDLRTLWREPVINRLTPAVRRTLLNTATTSTFQKHGMQHLRDALLRQQDEPEDLDETLSPDVRLHAERALCRGFFLSSEPRFIEYWIDLKVLGFGQDLLLRCAGQAIREICAGAELNGPVLTVNLIDGLAHEFSLKKPTLAPSDLGLTCEETNIVNANFDSTGRLVITPPLTVQPADVSSCAILLTPVDAYMGAHGVVASQLIDAKYNIIGVVPLVSIATSQPLDSYGWQADFLPVLRLAGNKALLHRRLRGGHSDRQSA
jgi:hypothetical protein